MLVLDFDDDHDLEGGSAICLAFWLKNLFASALSHVDQMYQAITNEGLESFARFCLDTLWTHKTRLNFL